MPKHMMTYKTKKASKKPKKVPKNSVEAVKVMGEYYVEAIVDHAFNTEGRLMYLLKWENYDESENSWEFDNQLFDCTEAREAFHSTSVGRHPPKYSWEEFDNFCRYLKKVVKPSFRDIAVFYKLSNKLVSICDLKDDKKFSQIKEKVETQTKELFETTYKERQRNSQRLKATQLATKVSKELRIDQNFGSIRGFIEFVDRRAKIDVKLEKWSQNVNNIIEKNGEGKPITVANDVDEEVPEFKHYICESVFDKKKFDNKSTAEKFTVYSCECKDCYDNRQECCSPVIGFPFVYNKRGVLSPSTINTNIIFECNDECSCGPDCANRVVQRGRQYRLELFRTEDASRGWGVRALEAMPKGAYVSSYVGEVISLIEANQRPTTYLFDLSASWDQTDNEYTYVIDANEYGNILRFVNHSCAPNCRMIFVWSDSYDRLLPKVCLFTQRSIRANEELTYDYGMQIINLGDPEPFEHSDSISTDSGNASNETNSQMNGPISSPKSPLSQSLNEEKVSKVSFKEIKCQCGAQQCRKKLYS